MRAAMVLLLAANVVAALVLFKPWGGSASDLARQLDEKRRELVQQNLRLERTKIVVAKVEKARSEGDHFLADYTLLRRTAFSTLVSEINAMAIKAGMKPKEASYVLEPVEGSEALEPGAPVTLPPRPKGWRRSTSVMVATWGSRWNVSMENRSWS